MIFLRGIFLFWYLEMAKWRSPPEFTNLFLYLEKMKCFYKDVVDTEVPEHTVQAL